MVKRSSLLLAFLISALAVTAFAQGDAVKPTYVKGDIVSVDGSKIVVKTDTGQWDGAITAKTAYKKVSPENPDMKSAVDAAAGDVHTGDKVLVSSLVGS